MNYIKKKIVLFISIFSIAIIGICSNQKDTYAKDYTGKLKVGRTYKSNLDKKGKQEKICVKYNLGNYTIYINNKKVFKTEDDINVYILDANKKDKQMEIFIVRGYRRLSIKYYKYKSSKLIKVQDLSAVVKKKYKNFNHLEILSENKKTGQTKILGTDLKGRISLRICIQLKNNLGAVGIKDILTLKEGKFVNSGNKDFEILDFYQCTAGERYTMENQKKMILRSKGTNKVYKKIGSSKVAFKLANEEKFYRQRLYIKDKKTYYIKIKTKKGKVGYVKNGEIKADEYAIDEAEDNIVDQGIQDCQLDVSP